MIVTFSHIGYIKEFEFIAIYVHVHVAPAVCIFFAVLPDPRSSAGPCQHVPKIRSAEKHQKTHRKHANSRRSKSNKKEENKQQICLI